MAAGSIASSPTNHQAGFCARTTNHAAQGFIVGQPPLKDVGYITSDVYVVIYLWNGTTADATLTSVTGDTAAEGITWDATPPDLVDALQSLRVIITVSAAVGPLEINGILTFSSSCNTVLLTLIGTRAPHLSGDVGYLLMPHNWEDGLDERLAWKTDILIAHDRTEQRIQLRTLPRRTWDLRLLVAGAARRKLETWLGLRKTRYLFAPVWRDVNTLQTPVAAGETTIAIDPQYLDYALDRWVAVFDAWDHFEIRAITGVGANFIAIDAPFAQDWPAGSQIAPCRYGLGLEQRRVSRFTEEVGEYRLTFEALNESALPAMESPETYGTVPVCPITPSWVGSDNTWDNKWVRLDNDTGTIEYDIQSIEPVISRESVFLLIGRAKIDQMFRFLWACSGRLAPFWIAADDRGFELAAPAAEGATTITIAPIDYEFALSGSPARSHIDLVTIDGIVIRRRITGVETLPDGNERLGLDAALPVAVSAATLNRCAWLELVRLDSDEINLHWVSGDCLELTLPIVVLP